MCYKRGNPGPCGLNPCGWCAGMPTTLNGSVVWTPYNSSCVKQTAITTTFTLTWNSGANQYQGSIAISGKLDEFGNSLPGSCGVSDTVNVIFYCNPSVTNQFIIEAQGTPGLIYPTFGGYYFNLYGYHTVTVNTYASCSPFSWTVSRTNTLGANTATTVWTITS